MHSGGGQKHSFSKCFIEADEETAITVFYNRFGTNPARVSCTCCGEDYSVSEEKETLEEATEFHRSNYVGKVDGEYKREVTQSCAEYIASDDVEVIWADDITDEDRRGDVPEQGFVYV
jgi:hypothetical protein